MIIALRVLTVVLVSIAMALALAHALELPGKLRLDKHTYTAVQPIYYPGFTYGGGVGEGLGMIATFLLLLLTPTATAAFWLILAAFIALVAMHASYWVFTHPVNKFWLEGQELKRPARSFFAFDPLRRQERHSEGDAETWKRARDRWEYSHVLRTGFAITALVAVVVAVAIAPNR